MVANTMNVPPRIRALVAAADNRPKAVRPRLTSARTPEVRGVVPSPHIGTLPGTVPKRLLPVRMMSKVAFRVYAINMGLALTFRWTATLARAFDDSFARRYWQATQFAGVHIQGVVTGGVAEARRAVCDGCEMRKKINRHDRCGAMGSCCPKWRFWLPTILAWLRWLVGWDCPRGKWSGIETGEAA